MTSRPNPSFIPPVGWVRRYDGSYDAAISFNTLDRLDIQRNVKPWWANQLASIWDDEIYEMQGPIWVEAQIDLANPQKPPHFILISGHHRVAAMVKLGRVKAHARIWVNITPEYRAKLIDISTDDKKHQLSWRNAEIFKANEEMATEPYATIGRICREHGYTPFPESVRDADLIPITARKSVIDIELKHHNLGMTLAWSNVLFGDQPYATSAAILTGLSKFLRILQKQHSDKMAEFQQRFLDLPRGMFWSNLGGKPHEMDFTAANIYEERTVWMNRPGFRHSDTAIARVLAEIANYRRRDGTAQLKWEEDYDRE